MTGDRKPDLEDATRRLQRRLDRERRARLEAEQIAEDRTRSLYQANQDLDRRIAKRTAELNAALAAATAAGQAKTAFLAQMSHQIKTPLNGLLGMLELLGNELSDDRSRDWHRSATRSALRLDRLAGRTITYAELEDVDLAAGAPTRQLHAVIEDLQQRWLEACLRAGQLLTIEFRPGSDQAVDAPRELDLLLDELLANVVEHGGQGAVTVTTRVVPDGFVEIEIADPGSGVDPLVALAVHGFDASNDQTQRGDGHVHLGLALVDRIAAALGGSWSVGDEGESWVSVRLPVRG